MPKKSNLQNFLKDGFNLPQIEEKVLEFWKENQIFEKSLVQRAKSKKFVFYEGPPTANGKPGIHHVLARAFKDIILRYKTMLGFYVPRRGGWDTHGLPVELEVEKKLGLKSKKEIEKYGIAEFNQKCKESVWEYKEEWEKLTERMGYWLDLKNPYITYETEYIETLWRIIAQFAEKNLFYKGHKVVPWCTRCGTALSSHELAQGYRETSDNSVYVKFKPKKGQKIGKFIVDDKTYVLSWTTTPWTLPGNVALAIGEKIEYVRATADEASGKIFKKGETYIFARGASSLWNGHFMIEGNSAKVQYRDGNDIHWASFRDIEILSGKKLVGLAYKPLFAVKPLVRASAHKVYAADFVTTENGTGVVHIAIMYGEDDYELGKKVGLPVHHTVDETGKFTKDVPAGLAGLYVKSKDAEEKIFRHMDAGGYKLKVDSYTHEYPYCWRCGTALIYYARSSWFVGMSKLKSNLLDANKHINWIPEHIKNGRFGEWLKEVKDWNFSRERYWGTPLPIWECVKCGDIEVIGGLEELSARVGTTRNKYVLMRHGEARNNVLDITYDGLDTYHLTKKGINQVKVSAQKLKKEKIDLIVTSDILRTKETAQIVSRAIGVKVVFDKRLREIKTGIFSGKPSREYHALSFLEKFEKGAPDGESLRQVRRRAWSVIRDIEKKYKNKKILIVSHDYVIWMLAQAARGWSESEAGRVIQNSPIYQAFVQNAAILPLDLRLLPRNDDGEVDLHRPYIDSVRFKCGKCGKQMKRVKELADVWFDSGAMPFAFAQNQKSKIKNQNFQSANYPADYICEAMDQTRGWFYTLLAVATALGRGAPYKNVISLGLINDKYGQKMSKSKGNVVNPWDMMQKYGIDAVRWYFYSATPAGEPKNFDEAEIGKSFRKFHMMLYNSLVFFKTYAHKGTGGKKKGISKNILDRWILARLNQTIQSATANLEKYDIRAAAIELERLADDLSRWYIRRSRRRFSAAAKGFGGQATKQDYVVASATLGFVLRELAKLIAPFTPFFAETLYQETRDNGRGTKESVHLEDWSMPDGVADVDVVGNMERVRTIASAGLARRAELGIKIRQPLAKALVSISYKFNSQYCDILKEEVNVKKVEFGAEAGGRIVDLDARITPELKEEGMLREIIRAVQELRQKAMLKPEDKIELFVQAPKNLEFILIKNLKFLLLEVGAKRAEFKRSAKFTAEAEMKLDDGGVWLGLNPVRSRSPRGGRSRVYGGAVSNGTGNARKS